MMNQIKHNLKLRMVFESYEGFFAAVNTNRILG
ncbi:MAG: hypothetical protein K0R92_1236 [Lachnospiraceae bacterium]|nr:hypothetical protein [Lachnospiraceae bacterium]